MKKENQKSANDPGAALSLIKKIAGNDREKALRLISESSHNESDKEKMRSHFPAKEMTQAEQLKLIAEDNIKYTIRHYINECENIKKMLSVKNGEKFLAGKAARIAKCEMAQVIKNLRLLEAFGMASPYPDQPSMTAIWSVTNDQFSIRQYAEKQLAIKKIEIEGMETMCRIVNDPATYIVADLKILKND